jgi:Integrase core domain
MRAIGIRDKPAAPASPWQNGFAERLIGSIRRECVDHFIVLSEAHLRWILRAYARYYNDIRTHRSLDKGAPVSRPVQRTGITRFTCYHSRTSSPLRPGLGFLVHTGRRSFDEENVAERTQLSGTTTST